MLLVPELVLCKIIDGCLIHLKNDYNTNHIAGTDDQSLLYKMCNGLVWTGYNYYREAVDLFTRDHTHKRKLEVSMFFNAQRASIPTIHISLPGETGGVGDGLGIDEGYQPTEFINTDDEDSFRAQYTRGFNSNYNILITSDNTMEVLLIYAVLRAMLISVFDTIELDGLRKPTIGGNDLRIEGSIVPPNVFIRAITLNFMYEVDVPVLDKGQIIQDIYEQNEPEPIVI